MLSFLRNNKSHDDIQSWQDKSREHYQRLLHCHSQNALTHVSSIGLIYDVIQLARFSEARVWAWKSEQAETHPALLTLCAFWQSFRREEESRHDARIPYIQVFLGKEHYIPLVPGLASMPIVIEDGALKKSVRESSVLFGDHFLITFLAGRRLSASKSNMPDLVHYTVQNKPLLKENLFFGHQGMTVSCQMLQGLFEFPKRFPALWHRIKAEKNIEERLEQKSQQEVKNNEAY